MGDKLSVTDSFVSRTIYLLNFSDILRFRTERQDKCTLRHVAHSWALDCPDFSHTYYSVS